MKKSAKLLIPLSILLLIGCNSSPKPDTPTDTDTPTTTQDQDKDKTNSDLPNFFKNGDVSFTDPQEIEILNQTQKDAILAEANKNIDPQYKMEWEYVGGLIHFYDHGEIINGPYKGQKLVTYIQDCDGPCFAVETNKLAFDETNHKITVLGKHSKIDESEFGMGYSKIFADKIDKTTEIKGLSLPEKIKLPNTDAYIAIETRDETFNFDGDQLPDFTSLFKDPEYGTIYFNQSENTGEMTFGCFYIESPDKLVSKYRYDPGFFVSGTEDKDGLISYKPAPIQWKNGEKSTDLAKEYAFSDTGCGIGGMCYTVEDVDSKDLILVGKSSSGIDLYEAKEPMKNQTIETFYTYWASAKELPVLKQDSESQKHIDTFLKLRPVLFWQDPLQRWSIVVSKEVKPAAECGKPVIYLYPQEKTDVNVKVGIEKLTETIPAYPRNGWTVSANPDGSLYNYADGKNYPYLYWEGQSYGKSSPSRGFVIERNKLSRFFDDSLAKLGLNTQEASDFKDFWVTRMLDNQEPYFFISFVGTQEFNKVAPLTITPTPDSLLRVFMYYKPLRNFVSVPSQELKAPTRKGFSVVEWGGTSSIPWRK